MTINIMSTNNFYLVLGFNESNKCSSHTTINILNKNVEYYVQGKVEAIDIIDKTLNNEDIIVYLSSVIGKLRLRIRKIDGSYYISSDTILSYSSIIRFISSNISIQYISHPKSIVDIFKLLLVFIPKIDIDTKRSFSCIII